MPDTPPDPQSPTACTTCGGLRASESAAQKYGWAADDTHLPAAAGQLALVRDLRPGSARQKLLQRCPACGTYYLYETDYEYLVNGSEDEQTLTRLTDETAARYLAPDPGDQRP